MNYRIGLSTLFAAIIFASSCNIDDLQFDNLYLEDASPTIAAEIGFANYTVSELLEELDTSTLIIDSTSSDVIEIRFELDPVTVTKSDVLDDTEIVEVEPVNESKTLRPFRNFNLTPVGGTLTNIFNETLTLDELVERYRTQPVPVNIDLNFDDLLDTLEFEFVPDSGTIIDQVYFNGGGFRFLLSGLDFQYRFTGLNTYEISDDSRVEVTHNRNENQPISLVNRYTNFDEIRNDTNPVDDSLNVVQFELNVRNVVLTPGESITNNTPVNVNVSTIDIDVRTFFAVTGSFTQQEFEIDNQTVEFSGLEDFTGTIEFQDPRVEMYVESYLGFPVNVDLNGIQVITSSNPAGLPLVITDNSISEINAVDVFEPFYQNLSPKFDTISINKNTSNIVDIFSEIPTEFIINTTASIENLPGSFATIPLNNDDPFVNVSGLAILPLDARISDVEQELDFEGIDVDELDDGETLQIQINYKNSIPLEISATIGFVSVEGDTTFADNSLLLGKNVETDQFDNIDESTLAPATYELDEDEVNLFLDAETVIVTLNLNSPPGEVTRLTTDQKIFLRLSALIGLTVKF